MKLTLNVHQATIVTDLSGEDLIMLRLDEPTTHPALGYDGEVKISVAAGYGVEWCQKVLGVINPKIISCK